MARCAVCGGPVTRTGRGRPPLTCSPGCRRKRRSAQRREQRGRPTVLAIVPEPTGEAEGPSLDERLRAMEPELVGIVHAAALAGQWRAAAWLLERAHPGRWARATSRPAAPESPVAGDDNPFAFLDEVAARRRGRSTDEQR